MDAKLPQPATQNDMYAYATVIELRKLNANIERLADALDEITLEPVGAESEEVELKEPEVKTEVESESAKKPSNRDAKKAAAKAETE